MLTLNSGPSKESLAIAKSAIMDILNCPNAGDAPKCEALKALAHMTEAGNVTVSHCSFVGGKAKRKK